MLKKARHLVIAVLFSWILTGCGTMTSLEETESVKQQARQRVAAMSLEEKVGQVLLPAIRKFDDGDIKILSPDVEKILRDCHPSGVIFFKNCFFDAVQTRALAAAVRIAATSPSGLPPFLGVDQEGGRVVRIGFLPKTPTMQALGEEMTTAACAKTASTIAKALADLGLNTNFAPVLDVNSNPLNPVIGDRSFGTHGDTVAQMGVAYMKATQAEGIIPVGKHFPGHGDTATDSHEELPVITLSRSEIEAIHLAPFQHAIDNGLNMIMTAHIHVPALDNTRLTSSKTNKTFGIPATLSKPILTDLLRKKMGFDGVITTDAMDMKAIADNIGEVEGAIMALNAGADLILMPAFIEPKDGDPGFKEIFNALVNAAKDGKITKERLDEAAERVIRLKLSRLKHTIRKTP